MPRQVKIQFTRRASCCNKLTLKLGTENARMKDIEDTIVSALKRQPYTITYSSDGDDKTDPSVICDEVTFQQALTSGDINQPLKLSVILHDIYLIHEEDVHGLRARKKQLEEEIERLRKGKTSEEIRAASSVHRTWNPIDGGENLQGDSTAPATTPCAQIGGKKAKRWHGHNHDIKQETDAVEEQG